MSQAVALGPKLYQEVPQGPKKSNIFSWGPLWESIGAAFIKCPPQTMHKSSELFFKIYSPVAGAQYQLPMSIIQQNNSDPLVNTGFEGFHDPFNYMGM